MTWLQNEKQKAFLVISLQVKQGSNRQTEGGFIKEQIHPLASDRTALNGET